MWKRYGLGKAVDIALRHDWRVRRAFGVGCVRETCASADGREGSLMEWLVKSGVVVRVNVGASDQPLTRELCNSTAASVPRTRHMIVQQ